ncbi:MAG: GNAT family N-acetyltransferase [Defluviitaleaceae bacterium]|nr:GNAT family N-acetyltransferase [Defluviitaleaceae bacterium]
MKKNNFIVRSIKVSEIDEAANLLSKAYYEDIFFKWCVPSDEHRHKIVTDYYKIYLKSKGCVSHVAENSLGTIVGVTVWLPHDAEESIYEEIEKVAGENAPQFASVAEKSHANEPTETPFYQLVGFGVLKEVQGTGVGQSLLKHFLDILDYNGIPTYLEASTPFHGGGVYGKFGYEPFGDLMVFTDTAVLYPLYRRNKNL